MTLTRILHYLCQKDKPIFYFETHAGKGLYDLKSPQAMKTGEALQGILPLWAARYTLPDLFLPYLNAIQAYNPAGDLRYYPGSPLYAMQQLRLIDRLFCCELHPHEFHELNQTKKNKMKVHFSHCDGLLQLGAMLPPPERRGLVFIDPSYEIKTDYQHVAQTVNTMVRRFNTGIYCIWYPILDKKWHCQMVDMLAKTDVGSHLRVEFDLSKPPTQGMIGCGLWIMNPPYILAEELHEALGFLVKLLNPGVSSYRISNT